MEDVFAFFPWLGFVGGWLLFAGPIHQAAVELHEQSWDTAEAEELQQRFGSIEPPPRISAWWWLLPPVAYILNSRRSRAWRERAFLLLTVEQRERFVSFSNKAAGWLIVATGAAFIAIKETAEIVERQHWPAWALVPMIVVPFALSVVYTVVRMLRTRRYERELLAEDPSTLGNTEPAGS